VPTLSEAGVVGYLASNCDRIRSTISSVFLFIVSSFAGPSIGLQKVLLFAHPLGVGLADLASFLSALR
jgi:hypothetical protein